MLKSLILAYLAALGMALLLWCLFGLLLYPLRSEVRVQLSACGTGEGLERSVRTLCWLRSCGLLRCEIWIEDRGLNDEGRSLARALARLPGVKFR